MNERKSEWHTDREHSVRSSGVLHGHDLHAAGLGVHRRLPELLRHHLAKALEPLDRHLNQSCRQR